MQNDEILEQLIKVRNKIRLFDELDGSQIKILVRDVIFKKFQKNETIFREGDEKNQFIYFILTGSVKVSTTDGFGVRRKITIVPRGSIIGELQAIAGNKRTATCTVEDDINILIGFTIKKDFIKENAIIYATFYKNLSTVLAQKISDTNTKIK